MLDYISHRTWSFEKKKEKKYSRIKWQKNLPKQYENRH